MYIEVLNDDLARFANTTSKDMLDHLFLYYGSITEVEIDQNFENMRKAWDPQQPVETNPRLCLLRRGRRGCDWSGTKTFL
jgi:hypothetical protein